jgi:hypothetical protein
MCGEVELLNEGYQFEWMFWLPREMECDECMTFWDIKNDAAS